MRPGTSPSCYPCECLTNSGECLAHYECVKGYWERIPGEEEEAEDAED